MEVVEEIGVKVGVEVGKGISDDILFGRADMGERAVGLFLMRGLG